jgi:hypothetical protein
VLAGAIVCSQKTSTQCPTKLFTRSSVASTSGEEASGPRFPSLEHLAALTLRHSPYSPLTTRTRHCDPYISSDVTFITKDGEIPHRRFRTWLSLRFTNQEACRCIRAARSAALVSPTKSCQIKTRPFLTWQGTPLIWHDLAGTLLETTPHKYRSPVDWCMYYEGVTTVQRSSNQSSSLISVFSSLYNFMSIHYGVHWTSMVIDRLIDQGPQTHPI